MQNIVSTLDPQQSPPSNEQASMLFESSQEPSPTHWLQPPLVVVPGGMPLLLVVPVVLLEKAVVVEVRLTPPPSRHWHSVQTSVLTLDPQQSPPSKLQSR